MDFFRIKLILLTTIPVQIFEGAKVEDRFKEKTFYDHFKCKVLALEAPKQDIAKPLNDIFNSVSDYFTAGFKRFNSCVIDYSITRVNLGKVVDEETGKFDGITGMVQRDEYQSATLPFKASAVPHQPVKIGPVIMPADMAIISFRSPRQEEKVQLEQFIYEFDPLTYTYIAIIIIVSWISMSLVLFIESWIHLRQERKISLRRFAKRSASNLYNLLMLLLNQILARKINDANRILWISVVFFVFVLIFNLLLSLIRSSYVVTRQPPYIESIQDLAQFFPQVSPVTFKGVYYLDTFRLSLDEDVKKIYKRLMADGDKNLLSAQLDFNPGTVSQGMPILRRITNGSAAFLIDSSYVKIWKSGLCNWAVAPINVGITPELTSRFTSTRTLFAPGILTTMFSHQIDPFLYKRVSYYFITNQEMGLFIKSMLIARYTRYFEEITQWNLTMCVDASEQGIEDIDDHKQLEVENIWNFLIMIGRLFGLGLGVLIVEIAINLVVKGERQVVKKRRFKKVAKWTLVNQ